MATVVIPLGVEVPAAPPLRQRGVGAAAAPALADRTVILFPLPPLSKKGSTFCSIIRAIAVRFGGARIAGPAIPRTWLPSSARSCTRHAPGVSTGPPVMGDEKTSLLAAADLFVLPLPRRNFGIALVEALAAGLPFVLSDEVAFRKPSPTRALERSSPRTSLRSLPPPSAIWSRTRAPPRALSATCSRSRAERSRYRP